MTMESPRLPSADEILEDTNLLPAAVPTGPLSGGVVTQQPLRKDSLEPLPNLGATRKQSIAGGTGHRRASHSRRQPQAPRKINPSGLARLSATEHLLVEIDLSCFRCDWKTTYSIKDAVEVDSQIFTATEELSCCNCGGLRNVVIRDRDNMPVARACFKEKSCFYNSLVLAVYSPPESLIGTVEELSGLCMQSSKWVLGDQDGNNLFRIEYCSQFCNTHFSILSLENGGDEVAKVLKKDKRKLRLQFLTKLSITNKLIIVGFCVGLIHKNMTQEAEQTVS